MKITDEEIERVEKAIEEAQARLRKKYIDGVREQRSEYEAVVDDNWDWLEDFQAFLEA